MKSRIQIRKKRSQLARQLSEAEEEYTESIGQSGERTWARKIKQLEIKIEMLTWVLDDQGDRSKEGGS